jgi:hypothetical protein
MRYFGLKQRTKNEKRSRFQADFRRHVQYRLHSCTHSSMVFPMLALKNTQINSKTPHILPKTGKNGLIRINNL